MKETIRQRAFQLGFDACGFTSAAPPESAAHFQRWIEAQRQGEMGYMTRTAQKRIDPAQVLPGARSIVCLAASYHRTKPTRERSPLPPERAGVMARYAQFRDYHEVLAVRLRELSAFIDERAGPPARSLWYVDTGPLLERDLAQRAGLGFIGKHTNLIARNLGNWFFLCEILTTAALEPDAPEKNRCGTCARCLEACPTNAITGPFELDARRCISYLTIEFKGSIPMELRRATGRRIYGCDDCLAACPWNRFAREGALMREHVRSDLDVPDLLDLLELDAAAFKRRFAETPVLRAKRRGLLRNVCVALGNVGDDRAVPALTRATSDPEPLIAEHARWALTEIAGRKGGRGE